MELRQAKPYVKLGFPFPKTGTVYKVHLDHTDIGALANLTDLGKVGDLLKPLKLAFGVEAIIAAYILQVKKELQAMDEANGHKGGVVTLDMWGNPVPGYHLGVENP